jgi:hypothetical protein
MWTIKKLGYSSNPWRLLDEHGNEVYQNVRLEHPDLGVSSVSMPVCANTKQELVQHVLDAFVAMRDQCSKLRRENCELKKGKT